MYIGKCNGNNNNGCFMDSCGHNCGCFKKIDVKKDDDLELLLNDILVKAMCLKGRIKRPNTNNIAEFVSDYLKKKRSKIWYNR